MSDEVRTRRRPAVSDDAKLQRRDEIMVAAKKVFARSGFHTTTIAGIAKEADLAYGSVYQYFDSKDDLFHALMSAEGYALRTHVAVALAATGERSDRSWAPLRAAVQATFEYFEKDKATAKLLLRDAYALGAQFETHLNNIYEQFIDDIDQYMAVAQQRGKVISAPPRMVAYTVAALIGQLAHRRLITDDGVTAADVADFVIEFIGNGLRPRAAKAAELTAVADDLD
ncbi:MAG: TetR/AcrR family transcriptional regulator [Mycobacterium sp.]|uniref:TetR/AcrR family transcriptional regulator n=2 Tax=Mycobacterium sp. TaxID=1785 RepID=UPI003C8FDB11